MTSLWGSFWNGKQRRVLLCKAEGLASEKLEILLSRGNSVSNNVHNVAIPTVHNVTEIKTLGKGI